MASTDYGWTEDYTPSSLEKRRSVIQVRLPVVDRPDHSISRIGAARTLVSHLDIRWSWDRPRSRRTYTTVTLCPLGERQQYTAEMEKYGGGTPPTQSLAAASAWLSADFSQAVGIFFFFLDLSSFYFEETPSSPGAKALKKRARDLRNALSRCI